MDLDVEKFQNFLMNVQPLKLCVLHYCQRNFLVASFVKWRRIAIYYLSLTLEQNLKDLYNR